MKGFRGVGVSEKKIDIYISGFFSWISENFSNSIDFKNLKIKFFFKNKKKNFFSKNINF